jgi:hypothetical protein
MKSLTVPPQADGFVALSGNVEGVFRMDFAWYVGTEVIEEVTYEIKGWGIDRQTRLMTPELHHLAQLINDLKSSGEWTIIETEGNVKHGFKNTPI